MIISHKHQFIFMHDQKTAGSTITCALNPHLGPRDIQTMGWGDTLRNGGRLNRRAKFILLANAPHLCGTVVKRSFNRENWPFLVSVNRINRIIKDTYQRETGFSHVAHPTAAEVKAYDEDRWRNYFKFSVVRNPWDHAVSYYHWTMHQAGVVSVPFKEYLKRVHDWDRPDPEAIRPPRRSGWEKFAIDGEIALDYIARFERLAEDTDEISRRIGIPIDLGIRTKNNIRSKSKSLADYYDDVTVELVRQIYSKEIDYFGYDLPF